MNLNVLIVDDEPGLRSGLGKILSLQQYGIFEASTTGEARDVLKKTDIDLILLDLRLGEEDGFEFLESLKIEEPLIPVIIITGYGDIKDAVACLKAGAINYITKPIDRELLGSIIEKEFRSSRLAKENIVLRESLEDHAKTEILKSHHSGMKEIDFIVERVKDSPATVLILGESGTGKEVTARAIHYAGAYRDRPFVGVNCAALNDNLLESELFGHERGAFTGAIERKLGRFELTGNGTLFLDEVGDMSLAMQAKLLRVLQERSFERVGGTKSIRTGCRIIASSNRDLKKMIKSSEFREDLYYRLSLIVIQLPPLRERRSDLESFVDLFVEQANREYGRRVSRIDAALLERLKRYTWPGNIRQLKNVITNAVILSKYDVIETVELFDSVSEETLSGFEFDYRDGLKKITSSYTQALEKRVIERALQDNHGNVAQTSRRLGITRKTLYEKMQKYDLEVNGL